MKQYLTPEQVAEQLATTPKAVRKMAKDGVIPYYLIGARMRFVGEEVDTHLNARHRVMSCREATQLAYGRPSPLQRKNARN